MTLLQPDNFLTIWSRIYLFAVSEDYSIWLVIDPSQERENTITRYRVIEADLISHVVELPQNYDLMTVVMLCLGSLEAEQAMAAVGVSETEQSKYAVLL